MNLRATEQPPNWTVSTHTVPAVCRALPLTQMATDQAVCTILESRAIARIIDTVNMRTVQFGKASALSRRNRPTASVKMRYVSVADRRVPNRWLPRTLQFSRRFVHPKTPPVVPVRPLARRVPSAQNLRWYRAESSIPKGHSSVLLQHKFSGTFQPWQLV